MSYYQGMEDLVEIVQGIVTVGIRSNVTKAYRSLDENDQIKYESAIFQLNRITGIDKDWLDGLIRSSHVRIKEGTMKNRDMEVMECCKSAVISYMLNDLDAYEESLFRLEEITGIDKDRLKHDIFWRVNDET